MNADKMKKAQDKIHEEIEKTELARKNLKPMCDGVADIPQYLSSKPKIMWILKEPYDGFTKSGKPEGGDWKFTDWFKESTFWDEVDPGNKRTFRTIAAVSYNLHHNTKFLQAELDSKEIQDELKSVAYINTSKMPRQTNSSDNLWKSHYSDWKDILLEQIKLYEPDVIIFGKTFDVYKDDLKITEKPFYKTRPQERWSTKAYKKDGIIYINTYHPSRKGNDYISPILKAVSKA